MSFYTRISIGGEIKKELVGEFKKAIKEIKAKREKIIENGESDYKLRFVDDFFNNSSFKITVLMNRFWLQTDDFYTFYFGNWCFDDEFITFIAPFMEPQDIEFESEDGEYWGYRIKENGKVIRLERGVVESVEL